MTDMPPVIRVYEHEFYGLQIVPEDDEAFRIDWPVHFERSVKYYRADKCILIEPLSLHDLSAETIQEEDDHD